MSAATPACNYPDKCLFWKRAANCSAHCRLVGKEFPLEEADNPHRFCDVSDWQRWMTDHFEIQNRALVAKKVLNV